MPISPPFIGRGRGGVDSHLEHIRVFSKPRTGKEKANPPSVPPYEGREDKYLLAGLIKPLEEIISQTYAIHQVLLLRNSLNLKEKFEFCWAGRVLFFSATRLESFPVGVDGGAALVSYGCGCVASGIFITGKNNCGVVLKLYLVS